MSAILRVVAKLCKSKKIKVDARRQRRKKKEFFFSEALHTLVVFNQTVRCPITKNLQTVAVRSYRTLFTVPYGILFARQVKSKTKTRRQISMFQNQTNMFQRWHARLLNPCRSNQNSRNLGGDNLIPRLFRFQFACFHFKIK